MKNKKFRTRSTNRGCLVMLIVIIPIIMGLFGYIRNVYKMCSCNFDPIGKAEIFYTIGTFTGAGVVIGYFNIEDK